MRIALWLLRTYPAFRPDRFGPFKTDDDRDRVAEELREMHPGCKLLVIDVFADGDIYVSVPLPKCER